MSEKHPIIAITGSSGSGSPILLSAIDKLMLRANAKIAYIDGSGFHRWDRNEFKEKIRLDCEKQKNKFVNPRDDNLSHFSPRANLLSELEQLMKEYAETGTGKHRQYIHCTANDPECQQKAGTFTDWTNIEENADFMVYSGLHGCFKTDDINIAQHPDLKIGLVPVVNLEWIQKIHRDTSERGYSEKDVTNTILRRLYDYVHYVTPQFSHTDINFQRVPYVDTSNPFIAREVPTIDESMMVIRIRSLKTMPVDFTSLLSRIQNSFMSRRNTIVVPGAQFALAVELLLGPIFDKMLAKSKSCQ